MKGATLISLVLYSILSGRLRLVCSTELPDPQYQALHDLYNATKGANWYWTEPFSYYGYPWEFTASANPCADWQGVACSNRTGAMGVTSLKLSQMNLNGWVPDSIGNLTDLQYLALGSNHITGTIPDTIYQLSELTTLDLSNAYLRGTISTSVGNLVGIQYLYLEQNFFTGSIPLSVCLLHEVLELNLAVNPMSGPIPVCISNLTSLQLMSLYENNLSGTLPSSIGELVHLIEINLDTNLLKGTIPESWVNLTELQVLFMHDNYLSGTIPAFLGQLTELTDVYLDSNFLEGIIPSVLGNLHQLTDLSLDFNLLTGPIPESLCGLAYLSGVVLGENYLTSTIPACLGDLVGSTFLRLEVNRLVGSIPESLCNLINLQAMRLDNNLLTGSIPSCFANFTVMLELYLNHNQFTGPFPLAVWSMSYLEYLYLNHNRLTGALPAFTGAPPILIHMNLSMNEFHGTIPSTVDQLPWLVVLCLSSCHLTGTLPATIGYIPLSTLQLSHNMLTGSVPGTFVQLNSLVILSLQGNQLTGSLDNVFNATQANLITVQLDDNQFTGELPAVLFDLPSLISLSIVGSCLHGTLPSNICNATSLEALVLYGLTTGASCRAVGVNSLSTHQRVFGGALPECVLTLPKLRTLLLASNGLTGQIPSLSLNDSLFQLDLSHNSLTGTIPMSIQNHSWSLLDLSHNKLGGVLSGGFFHYPNVTLHIPLPADLTDRVNVTRPTLHVEVSLDTNRLSGRVPNHIKPLRDVSVLAGNLFQCAYDKGDLPPHDTDISNYECASNSFDLSVYLWVGLIVMVGCAVIRYRHLLHQDLPVDALAKLQHLQNVLHAFDIITKTGVYCAAFCMFVLMPYYAIISQYRGTHTHQYAYVLSAIYTSGALPFALDVVLWIALLIVLIWLSTVQENRDKSSGVATANSWAHVNVWVVFAAVNVAVVMGVNIAFVYTVLYQSTAAQTAAQVLLSLFKLGWSTAVSPWMIRQLDNHFIPVSEGPAEPFFTLQLLVALFNNIAIPCLVVMAVDPNCFSEIFLPSQSEEVNYLLPVCVQDIQRGLTCNSVMYERSSLQFTPPFTYSYQCSASFITSYAPTFVYMSIATVFVNPLLRYGMILLHANLTSAPHSHKLLSALLPRILLPPPADPALVGNKRERPLFRAVGILVTLLMQLGVLLTLGAIFPPVALAMAVSIVATVYTTRLELRRFIQATLDAHYLHCLCAVDFECSEVGTTEQLRTAVMLIVCFCCAFYTLFLFDTLGDAEGFDASVWVLIVVPLSPVLLFVSLYAYNVWASPVVVQEDPASIEMKTVADTNTCEADLPTLNVLHPALV